MTSCVTIRSAATAAAVDIVGGKASTGGRDVDEYAFRTGLPRPD